MNLLQNDVKLCSFQVLKNQHHFNGFDMNFRRSIPIEVLLKTLVALRYPSLSMAIGT